MFFLLKLGVQCLFSHCPLFSIIFHHFPPQFTKIIRATGCPVPTTRRRVVRCTKLSTVTPNSIIFMKTLRNPTNYDAGFQMSLSVCKNKFSSRSCTGSPSDDQCLSRPPDARFTYVDPTPPNRNIFLQPTQIPFHE